MLSADEINAYLKDNKNVLNFNQDANADVNPFTTKAFVAKELKGGLAADHNFVYVTDKENENSYLKVDTAANGVGIQFLKFGWTNAEKEPNKDVENSTLANQHKFLFSYVPASYTVNFTASVKSLASLAKTFLAFNTPLSSNKIRT